MPDDELTPEPAAEPAEETAEPGAASKLMPEPPPEAAPATTEATTEATPADAQDDLALFAESARERLLTAHYGVSAGVGVTCVQRGDGDLLLIFETKEAQEALIAASAALATVPDDDTRVWRFAGSGPDLETGRARAVVRISRPASSSLSSTSTETSAEPAQ